MEVMPSRNLNTYGNMRLYLSISHTVVVRLLIYSLSGSVYGGSGGNLRIFWPICHETWQSGSSGAPVKSVCRNFENFYFLACG